MFEVKEKDKIPKFKHQITNKLQAPITKKKKNKSLLQELCLGRERRSAFPTGENL
jgi:hypothetical protein